MATALLKELKRQVTVDGADYIVTVDPDRVVLTGKGKRRPVVVLRWRDLLSGDAALSVALNASLSGKREAAGPIAEQPRGGATRRARNEPAR